MLSTTRRISSSRFGKMPNRKATSSAKSGGQRTTNLLPAAAEQIDCYWCISGAGLKSNRALSGMTRHKQMLTSKTRELLCKADIIHGILNSVPVDAINALVDLRIVDGQWQEGATAAAAAMHVNGVKLTAAGIQLASSLQGIEKVRCP
jgi:hypothetical protein